MSPWSAKGIILVGSAVMVITGRRMGSVAARSRS